MHLLIGKEKEEIKRALSVLLREVKVPIHHFHPENFSAASFTQEVETLPFLDPKKAVAVHDIDQLPKEGIEAIQAYLEKPNSWLTLFLTAGELSPQCELAKLADKNGKVTRFKEEKPWEKEKRLAEWLVLEAKREKVRLSMQAAIALVQGVDHQMLKCELDKLICFAGPKQEITLEDISLLSTPVHHETLWQLGDALFTRSTARALQIGSILLEEGMALILLLASLRTQFMTGMEILSLGRDAVKKFPYLKGTLLDKKLALFKAFGKEALTQGVLLIFDTELKAKNSATEPALLLEILITRL